MTVEAIADYICKIKDQVLVINKMEETEQRFSIPYLLGISLDELDSIRAVCHNKEVPQSRSFIEANFPVNYERK
jgi:hypothetical protein